jgi:ABC-type antimicrobial peptide transport system permease subunit
MPPGNEYFEAPPRNAFITDLTESLKHSSFAAFGFSTGDPFSFGASIAFRLPGEMPAESRRINYQDVSPGYLETLHVSIVAGRSLERVDATRPVALINETMARKYWPHENPIGKTFVAGRSETREIVGIVRNVSDGLDEAYPMFYQALGSSTSGGGIEIRNGRRVVTDGGPMPLLFVRGTGAAAAEEIAGAVARIDARMRLQARPLAVILEERQKAFRVGPILAALLGTFALALATVGMFGVFAYAVRQRTREIGIRMALGARPADVVRLILVGHSRAVVGGLAVGFVGSLGTSQIIHNFAYGISPFDPIAYLWVATLLGAAGLLASVVPARRATRINPIEALRCD